MAPAIRETCTPRATAKRKTRERKHGWPHSDGRRQRSGDGSTTGAVGGGRPRPSSLDRVALPGALPRTAPCRSPEWRNTWTEWPPHHPCHSGRIQHGVNTPKAPRAQKEPHMHQPTPPAAVVDDERRTHGGSAPGAGPPSCADRAGTRRSGFPSGSHGWAPSRPQAQARGPAPVPSRAAPPPTPGRPLDLPPAHTALVCVALPGFAISTEQGQLTGHGLEGFYRAGRRVLSRCQVRVAGREPLAVQARMTAADTARFVGTLRTSAHTGPDPDVVVERIRGADGTERITLHSAALRPLRLSVEVALGTDLADLATIASGNSGHELPASVHDSGLRWSCATGKSSVTAVPAPHDALASAGLLRWDLELPPGGSTSVELRVRPDGAGPLRAVGRAATSPCHPPGRRETAPESRHSCARASRTSSPCCCATPPTRWTRTWPPACRGAVASLRRTHWPPPG